MADRTETEERASASEVATLISTRPVEQKRGFFREHPILGIGGIILFCALLVGAFLWWRYAQKYEETDDAQIDGHINSVSTRVSGTVLRVLVSENQEVKRGDLLIELDPRDYQVNVDRLQANVAQAEAQIRAELPAVPITRTTTRTSIATANAGVANAKAQLAAAERDHEAQLSRVTQAEANNARAQADLQRYTALVNKDEVSRLEYDQRVAAAKSASAALAAEQASAHALLGTVGQRKAELAQAESELAQASANAPQELSIRRANLDLRRANSLAARAAVEEAKLSLDYTKIPAPIDGVIGRKSVEVGSRVQPGQQLLSIVPLHDIWVTANYKETQLANMRVGLKATIHVDAYDRDYDGVIESLPAATAAKFSILPPENASGNYVKVVQRLPVRLRFREGQDEDHRLSPGMSVVTKVWIK
jgi:membrane fusion protein (multidrug efflux system)